MDEMTENPTACKGRRRPIGWAAIALVAVALLPGVGRAGGPDEEAVTLSIANESPQPLRCTVLFAHFVSKDVGTIAPRAEVALSMFRRKNDGALWIPRADGRRMMIETIDCAALSAEMHGQVPLLSVRASHHLRYRSSCRQSSTLVCADPVPAQ